MRMGRITSSDKRDKKAFMRWTSRACLMAVLLQLCFIPLANGDVEGLFSKIKIQPVRDKKMAPAFSLDGLSGRRFELKQFKGKVVFLTFWATWCGPCKEELPSIEALHRQFKGKEFAVLSVAVDLEGAGPVEKFIAKQGYTFYVLVDSKGETLDLYRIEGIPTTFLIDKKGRIIGKAIGPRNWKSPDAISLIGELIDTTDK
jgi:thiol-disulfide isomerase/thioredoxin